MFFLTAFVVNTFPFPFSCLSQHQYLKTLLNAKITPLIPPHWAGGSRTGSAASPQS